MTTGHITPIRLTSEQHDHLTHEAALHGLTPAQALTIFAQAITDAHPHATGLLVEYADAEPPQQGQRHAHW